VRNIICLGKKMYEPEYNPKTGILVIGGDHYDIDQALDVARLDRTRLMYRSSTVPKEGLQVTENSGPPVIVDIQVQGENILTATLKMTVSPVLGLSSTPASQKRVQDITATLESSSGTAGLISRMV